MGGKHSEPYNQKDFLTQWQKVAENQGRTIWRNKQDATKQLEQYPIYANNEHDVQKQTNLYQLRRNSKSLVSASYLKSTTKSGLCSTASQGKLFLQKIPIRLQDIKDIPFPDILHLHQQALNGYQTLSSQVGPFKPSQQQIGFNNQGVAKVWLNSDFSRSTPNIVESSQKTMVRTILQMIESNTDRSTLPAQNPSILNFIYQRKNQVNFEQANGAIRQFATRYNNGFIPNKLDCIEKVGGTQRVYQSITQGNQQSQINNQTVFNSQNNQQFNSTQTQWNNPVNSSVVVSTFQQPQNHFVNVQRPSNVSTVFVNQQQPSNLPLSSSKVNTVNTINTNTVNTSNVVTVNRNFNQTPLLVNKPPVFVNSPVAVNNTPVFTKNTAQFVRPSFQNGSRVNEVRTVRPQQIVNQSPVFVRPPQQQRVIQQIVRNPPVQYQPIPVMQPITQVQQRRQNVNVNANNTNVPVPVSIPIQSKTQLNNQIRAQTLSNANNTSRTEVVSNQLNGESRNNVITSNTVDLIAGGKQFQSYNSSAQKYGKVQTSALYGKTQVTSTNYGVSDKVGGDVSLEDGKSSEALLRQLRQLSASRQKHTNFDTNFETTNYAKNYATQNNYDNYDNDYTYKYSSNNNYEAHNNYADTNHYAENNHYTQTTNHANNHYEAQNNYDSNNDYYGAFKKYANYQNGNVEHNQANDYSRGLQENLQMKYSMTQDLYDHNQNGQYNHSHQNNQEYEVDFDPQILADMKKMRG